MKYCTNCGKENNDTTKFCYSCGSPLQEGNTPVQNVQPTPVQPPQPTPTQSTTVYSNASKTMRLVVGIFSIVISLVVLFQSCFAGMANALDENGESGGTGGLFLFIVLLASGIISIAARKTTGGTITAIVFYVLGAVMAIAVAGSFTDLIVWAVISLIFAALLFASLFMKNKANTSN